MSIAVTAVVKPSRRLSAVVSAMCMAVLSGGTAIGFGLVGDLTFVLRMTVLLACMMGASYAFYNVVMVRTAHEIHISGAGQMRLAVWVHGIRGKRVSSEAQAEAVKLLASSTLWSGLLILHLQNEKRQTEVVRVLPDSVSAESFKALLVACRWIVMRHPEAENRHERQN
jgi:toxin CptA